MLINVGSGGSGLGSSVTPKSNMKKASSILFQMLETPRLVPLKYRKKIIFELRPIVYAVKIFNILILILFKKIIFV